MVWAGDANYTVVLHGGVCHRIPTSHKSGNKMKRSSRAGVLHRSRRVLEAA